MIIVKVCFFFTVFLVLGNAVALPSHFFSAGEQTAITGEVCRDDPPNLQDFFFAACGLGCRPAVVFITEQCVKKHQVSCDCLGTHR